MAETADDLSTPLGQETVRRRRRFRLPFTGMQALAVLLGLFLASFAGFAIFNDNPLGGEPMTRIAIRPLTPAEEKPAMAAAVGSEPGAKSAPKQTGTVRAEDRHHHRRVQRRAPRREDSRRGSGQDRD